MTSLRSHVARIRHEALAGLRSALNIASPSRVFFDAARAAERRQHAKPVPPPWYAARGPLEPYETPELAAAARRVHRLIRRHWWALFFEPESSTALSWLEALQQLGALDMTPQVEPGYARKFYEQVFGRADRGAT